MSAPVDVLAVLDRFCNSVLPVKLWDGSNPYCNRPGREGSDYSDDLAALNEARAAVAQFQRDVQTSLSMLTADGLEDAPVAGFLRAAIARVGGAA